MSGSEPYYELTLAAALGGSGVVMSALGLILCCRPDAQRRSLAYLALGLVAAALAAWQVAGFAGELVRVSQSMEDLTRHASSLGDQLIEAQGAAVDPDQLRRYAGLHFVATGMTVAIVGEDGARRPYEPSDDERRARAGFELLREAQPGGVRSFALMAALAPLLSGGLIWLALWRRMRAARESVPPRA